MVSSRRTGRKVLSLERGRSAIGFATDLAPSVGTLWGAPSSHHPRYEWLWLYAAVHPRRGRVFWLVLPYLNAGMMQLFLDECARSHAISGKRIVLILDGATAHRAQALHVPERLTLVGLPADTPELNPTARLWPLVKEGIANRRHSTLETLEQEVCPHCQRIATVEVAALTTYHWWPTL